MRLVAATTNPHKMREIRELLTDLPIALAGLADLSPLDEPIETGETFAENARLKAAYYGTRLDVTPGTLVVAEDSGLIVDALEGEPGVRSARFLGEEATYPERFAEIERRLAAHPDRPRTARFVCAVAVADGGRILFETAGAIEGEIARDAAGTQGFGYDPIFYYPPYGRTLAEVSQAEKLRVAHRGQAFRRLAEWLRRGHLSERPRES